MRTTAVIVAAGRGTRAQSGQAGPKQFVPIQGRALLSYAIQAFADHPDVDHVVVVIHPDDRATYDQMMDRDGHPAGMLAPVSGGATRQDSVRAGLQHLHDAGRPPTHVLIHDAARPFVTAEIIDRTIAALKTNSGVIAAVPVADTIQRTDPEGMITETINRADLWRAQTPQGFAFPDILEAHNKAVSGNKQEFTDDATLFTWAGGAVTVVVGAESNTKITTQEDLSLAVARDTSGQPKEIRTGSGFDVHRCGPGDHVWLCGLKISASFALIGHSDADVALHALTDALLGAVGAGDIGSHFPPTDPKWKDTASEVFLAHAAKCVADRGGGINNVDVTIICEQPKIHPHREQMRAEIARILNLPIEKISVKATTSEGLGFAGRGEGLAAMATVTVALA